MRPGAGGGAYYWRKLGPGPGLTADGAPSAGVRWIMDGLAVCGNSALPWRPAKLTANGVSPGYVPNDN